MHDVSRMRGGNHRDKVVKKQARKPKGSEPQQGQLEQEDAKGLKSDKDPTNWEYDKDHTIQTIAEHSERDETHREFIAWASEGRDAEVEQKIQWYLTKIQSLQGWRCQRCLIVESGGQLKREETEETRKENKSGTRKESAFPRRRTVRGDTSSTERDMMSDLEGMRTCRRSVSSIRGETSRVE